ncbi:hypothetical protein ABT370_05105 [Streptomyces rubradiris]|uniref:hypothetical protein n=1 Tax=Streptomyces rubradiris TaxID=285531 RepID=UPI00332E18A0
MPGLRRPRRLPRNHTEARRRTRHRLATLHHLRRQGDHLMRAFYLLAMAWPLILGAILLGRHLH